MVRRKTKLMKLFFVFQSCAFRTDDVLAISSVDDEVIEIQLRGIQEPNRFEYDDEEERDEAWKEALAAWGDAVREEGTL